MTQLDTKVSDPGVYDMPIERYHSDCCDAMSLSSGDLVALAKNPAKWFAHHWSNPDRFESTETHALSFGRAVHAIVVGGESFEENYAVRPAEFDSWRTKAAQEWREERIKAGMTVLVPNDVKVIKAMARAIVTNPHAKAAFEDGLPEQSLFWKDGDIWRKARPDLIPARDSRIVLDYKSVTDLTPYPLKQAIWRYGWVQKLANVAEGLIKTGVTNAKTLSDMDYLLVCQEKSPPYEVVVVTIPPADIAECMMLNAAALDQYRQSALAHDAGDPYAWPGQHEGFMDFHLQDFQSAENTRRFGGIDGIKHYPLPVPLNETEHGVAA